MTGDRRSVVVGFSGEAKTKKREITMSKEQDGFVEGGVPVCGFCNAPWTEDMVNVFDIDASHGSGSYDFGPENPHATVDITCSTCNRLIYRKEFRPDW